MYRKRKALRLERKRAALAWLAEHPSLAQRLQDEAAAHVTWKSLWLGIESETDTDIPKCVKQWLQKSAGG
jgi:hypothetical protein